MRRALISIALASLLLTGGIMPAGAWDRGDTEIFAILPDLPGGPVPSEGLTVGPDGTVYTPSFGINSKGAVPGPPHLFSFKPNGQLLYDVALVSPGSPQPSTLLLGLVFQKSSRTLLICDLSNGIVWQANPKTGKATVFMNTGQGFEFRPQRADLRQGGQRLRVGFVFGGHLEDRPHGRAAIDFRRFSDTVAGGRHGGDPGAAIRRQRRRVQQRIY
jgi:hypothetical protein